MAANNQIVLIGRLGQDPELRFLQSGKEICEVNIAVNRTTKGSDGEYITDWIRCQFWEKRAVTLRDYVKKGQLISVSGSLRIDTWEKDGQRQTKAYIHVEGFQMLESKKNRDQAQAQARDSGPQSAHDYNTQRAAPQQSPAQTVTQQSFDADEFALDDDGLPPF